MNNLSKPFSLNEAKIQAKILLKNLSSSNTRLIQYAQKRLNSVLALSNNSNINKIQLKHALSVIAHEHGFNSWVNLKTYFSLTGLTKFEPNGGGFFNQWFSSYNEAKPILRQSGGYLLPYRNQFFICESGYIEYIGLDKHASDWQAINYNWIEPEEIEAWQRLNNLYAIKNRHI